VKEINVSVTQSDGFVGVAITDRGIGIAAEEQEKIFEKFYRVSTGLVHDVKGSGLGLSLVKHIVVAHQGKITVRSKPGEGSAFTIHLPVTDQKSERQAGLANSESGVRGVDDAGNKLTG
jgi:signal transduction histidine kinase